MANPFYNWTRQQCLDAIATIQQRIALNALSVSHAGSGSVTQAAAERDERNVQYLRDRIDEIDGVDTSARVAGKAWRFDSRAGLSE